MHSRNDRFRTLGDGVEHARQYAGILQILFPRIVHHALHPIQIRAGAKRFAVTAEHNNPDIIARAEFDERLRDLGNQFVVKRVVHIRPVQHDAGHLFLKIDFQHDATS